MIRYLLLPRSSANRVYGAAAPGLAAAEVAFVAGQLFGDVVGGVGPARVGGVDYLAVDAARPLHDDEVAVLSNLTATYALFRTVGDDQGGGQGNDDGNDQDGGQGDDQALLAPVTVSPRLVQDEDVTTIQRYQGKTNEQFTHLLVNLTLAAAGDAFARLLAGKDVRLLDPLCGRGTSLNRAVAYGMDAVGIDADRRDLEAYHLFFTTWLKDKRVPHKATGATLRKGRDTPVRTFTITYGPDRKAPDHRVEVVNDDTTKAADHVRARSVDVIVADLPYGVQHENRGGGAVSRSPEGLLADALPAWAGLLRPGGAMGLSWNRRTVPRARMVELLAAAGLAPVGPPDGDGFVHKVDRVITRDLVVARRARADERGGAGSS